ncbi:Aromatic amino acid aminotransferase [Geobacillus sp. WSUCF1]|nr:Aromatic amino acid aminotransferase [Geobacillus sp. WSUCF1]
MKHLIQPRVQAIQLSGIRQFFNLVADRPGLVSLTIGQPDFPTPDHVKAAAQEAIAADFTTYTANAGLLELRQAACQFVADKYGLRYTPDEVIATVGASQALDIAFRTILEEGTEVLLPAPVYPGYEPLIRLCGAKPVYIDTRPNGFRLSAELIAPYLTEKTRCLVLPYPSNPTGTALSAEELENIASLLKGRPIWIVSDEIYSELVYHGRHHSIAEWLPEQTIVINGLSKSHSMTGWRIGFVFAPAFAVEQMVKVHQYSVSCTSSISQKAAVEALTAGKNDAEVMRAAYAERLEYATVVSPPWGCRLRSRMEPFTCFRQSPPLACLRLILPSMSSKTPASPSFPAAPFLNTVKAMSACRTLIRSMCSKKGLTGSSGISKRSAADRNGFQKSYRFRPPCPHKKKAAGSSPQHVLDKQYGFLHKDVQKSLIC